MSKIMGKTLGIWNKIFGKKSSLRVAPPVDRSPIERLLYYLTGLVYDQFMNCSLRVRVWLLLLGLLFSLFVLGERSMWVLALFECLDLESLLARFVDEDSRSTAQRFYPYLRVCVLAAGFIFLFFGLSPIKVIGLSGSCILWLIDFSMSSYESMYLYLIWLTEVLEIFIIKMFFRAFGAVSVMFDGMLLKIWNRCTAGAERQEYTEPPSEKILAYFFGSSSKEEKSLLVRFLHKSFDVLYKGFASCKFRTRVLILFFYFLVVFYLVVNNYQWALASFSREVNYADDYTILFKITDREEYPITHDVYSISWIYVGMVGGVLCLNLSPERMLSHHYALCLIPFLRSYFWAASSNIFLIIAIMVTRSCFFYKRRYLWFWSTPLVFVLISLFLLDLTVCFEDLGKDNIFRI